MKVLMTFVLKYVKSFDNEATTVIVIRENNRRNKTYFTNNLYN